MENKKINKLKEKIKKTLNKNNVTKAGLFGSYTRGEESRGSDIDILIEVKKGLSLLDMVKIKIELEKALRKKVDLVEYGTIKPLIKKQILNEEVKIL